MLAGSAGHRHASMPQNDTVNLAICNVATDDWCIESWSKAFYFRRWWQWSRVSRERGTFTRLLLDQDQLIIVMRAMKP